MRLVDSRYLASEEHKLQGFRCLFAQTFSMQSRHAPA
jgi:hypothetical protein